MESARTGLRWAFYPFVVGLALIPVGLFVFPWSAQIGTGLGGAGFLILLLGSCGAFVIIDSIVGASSIFGRAAVFISITFLAASILLFPNVIVFLMSNGQWPRPILGRAGLPVWVNELSVVPPVILILLPTILRKLIEWDNAEEATRRLATAWLAGGALAITCTYAIILHFLSGNPLSAIPLTGVVLAILFPALFFGHSTNTLSRSLAYRDSRSGKARETQERSQNNVGRTPEGCTTRVAETQGGTGGRLGWRSSSE